MAFRNPMHGIYSRFIYLFINKSGGWAMTPQGMCNVLATITSHVMYVYPKYIGVGYPNVAMYET